MFHVTTTHAKHSTHTQPHEREIENIDWITSGFRTAKPNGQPAMILTYWAEERDWWFLQNTQTIPTISHDSPWQGHRTLDSAREVNNIQESSLCNSGQPKGLSGDWLYKGDQVVVMEFLSQLFLPIWTEQSSSSAVHLSAPFYSTEIKSPVNLMPALI